MSIFKKQNVINSYPAYDVCKRETHKINVVDWNNMKMESIEGITEIDETDVLSWGGSLYQAGSIVSCALDNNECPIEAVERCKKQIVEQPHGGHKLHWISQLSVCISNVKQSHFETVEICVGMVVRFQGLIAEIKEARNNNLKFCPLEY